MYINIAYISISCCFLQSHDDKEKANSPFDTNGLKKDDQVTNTNGVVVNGIDDDKGFKWVVNPVLTLTSWQHNSICLSVHTSNCQSSSGLALGLGNGIDIRMPIPLLKLVSSRSPNTFFILKDRSRGRHRVWECERARGWQREKERSGETPLWICVNLFWDLLYVYHINNRLINLSHLRF